MTFGHFVLYMLEDMPFKKLMDVKLSDACSTINGHRGLVFKNWVEDERNKVTTAVWLKCK